jgi:hypothetical protein
MAHHSFILLLAVILSCGGCQSISTSLKRSASNVADDYHRVTYGTGSSYIAEQRSQP